MKSLLIKPVTYILDLKRLFGNYKVSYACNNTHDGKFDTAILYKSITANAYLKYAQNIR